MSQRTAVLPLVEKEEEWFRLTARIWLMLLIALTVVSMYDNVFAGGLLSWSQVITGIVLLWWGVRWLRGKERLTVPWSLALPLAAMVVWVAVTLLWSENVRGGALELISWVRLFALFNVIYVAFWDDIAGVRLGIGALIGALTSVGMLAIYVIFFRPSLGAALPGPFYQYPLFSGYFGLSAFGRILGFHGDPNGQGLMFLFAAFFTLGFVMHQVVRGGRTPWWSLAIMLPLTVGVLGVLSRSTWLAMAVGGAYLGYYIRFSAPRLFWGLAVAGAALLLAFAPALLIRTGRVMPTEVDRGRLAELHQGLAYWRDAPLQGIGPGTYRVRIETIRAQTGKAITARAIHNTYLKFLVEGGVVGLGLLLWFVVALVRTYRSVSRRLSSQVGSDVYWVHKAFGACFLAVVIWALFQGITFFNLWWIMLGMFAALSHHVLKGGPGDVLRRG